MCCRPSHALRRFAAVGLVASILAGCASPATHEAMIVSEPTAAGLAIPSALKGQIALRDVTGGKETNPMWMSTISSSAFEAALEASLRNAGLGAPSRDTGRYLLGAAIQKIEQPLMGFSLTVTTTVHYDLLERATSKPAWARTITRSHTTQVGDALLATERLRLANEGSARANIQGLIEELVKSMR
jgi:hypothetical protein